MSLINMSLVASVLIIGIVLFRSLFVHRIPKKIMTILWGIVILRLVFPTSISLPFPIGGSLMQVQPSPAYAEVAVTATTDLAQQEIMEFGNAEIVVLTVELSEGEFFGKTLWIIYLAGAAIMFLGSVYLYVRDSRYFRESLPMGELERKYLVSRMLLEEKEQKYLEKVCFRISDRTVTPVTYGVLKPAIVFPKGIFLKEEKEVSFCLLHELVHVRNHDNLRKLIVHAVLCIHWFNPFVWVMYFLVNRDMELLCDEMAVRKCKADRQDYALALLSLAERRAAGFRTALGFGKNAVKERILAVMSDGKTTFGGMIAAVATVALAVIVFLSSQMTLVVASAETSAEYTIVADSIASADEEYMVTAYSIGSSDVVEAGIDEGGDVISNLYFADEAVGTSLPEQESGMGVIAADVMKTAEMTTDSEDDVAVIDKTNWALEEDKDTDLPDSLVKSLQELEKEFEGTEFHVVIGRDDYQLYYEEIPVYFFADNRAEEDEGFSGRVFAREAGNGNGDIGVETVRDEKGVIVGLRALSEEESREVAKAWTGRN